MRSLVGLLRHWVELSLRSRTRMAKHRVLLCMRSGLPTR